MPLCCWRIEGSRHDLVAHQAPNLGYASALNMIIKASRGDFLAIFDDDDESRQDRLTKQWRRITDYERLHGAELVLCYANREVVPVGQTTPDEVAMAIGREPPEPRGPIGWLRTYRCRIFCKSAGIAACGELALFAG
jgi:glycosyltransferase involved in cell wall biosynthesis